jgi:hypothetical protein
VFYSSSPLVFVRGEVRRGVVFRAFNFKTFTPISTFPLEKGGRS